MKLSIVVATFNRPDDFSSLILSIENQRYVDFEEIEIVVVYGAEKLKNKKKYDDIFLNNKLNIKSIFIDEPLGPGLFKNIGVKNSESELILFVDDDTILTSFFIKNVLKFSEENLDVEMWGGLSITGGMGKNASYSEKLSFTLNSWKTPIYCQNEIFFIPGLNMCVRKKSFLKVNGFSKKFSMFCEDSELTLKFKRENLKLSYNKEQILFHKPPFNFYKLLIKFFKYGIGNGELRCSYDNYPNIDLKRFFNRNISYISNKSKKDTTLVIGRILKDIFYYSGELYSIFIHYYLFL